jgi:hypothetical protein
VHHAPVIWIARYALPVSQGFLKRRELHLELEFRVRLRLLACGSIDSKPVGDGLASGNLLRRDFDVADKLCAENVIIFDLEFQIC